MSQVSSTGSATSASNASRAQQENGLNDVDINDFLTLLITEMQNQDPLNPMENADMLQQIGLIREIGATNDLTDSLTSLSQNQQLTTASSLIGRKISALSDDAQEVTGTVERISVTDSSSEGDSRIVKVHVDGKTIDINNIREILES